MSQLDVVCNMSISFNVNSSWTSWTLDIDIVSAILAESKLFGPGIGTIGNVISFSFCAYVAHSNLILYVSYTSI
jgi:hypothetical protein